MKLILMVFTISAALFTSACSSMSTKPEAKNVKVTREKPTGECTSLGKIEGRTNSTTGTADDALKDLQQEAANKGANQLVVEQYSASGQSVTGIAYKCE